MDNEIISGNNVVIISPQRWGKYWVSKHWISDQLAKNNRVLYVAPSIWIGGLLRNPLRLSILNHLVLERSRRIKKNLHIFSPVLWPRPFQRTHDIEAIELNQIKKEVENLSFKDSILINFDINHHLIGNLGERVSVYYCVDPDFPRDGKENYEKTTCLKSDIIYAVSEEYRRKLKLLAPSKKVITIPHGYDFNLAQKVRNNNSLAVPLELAKCQRPIIGYIGSLHDMTIDSELVMYLSVKRPQWSFVFIGPHKNNPLAESMKFHGYDKLKKVHNVHFLGAKPYHELPHYIKHFDVALVLINHSLNRKWRTRQRTSFKLLQYLSQGIPIVAQPMNDFLRIEELIYIRETYDSFLLGIESALQEDPVRKQDRITYASQFSYDKILAKISKPILSIENDRMVAKQE